MKEKGCSKKDVKKMVNKGIKEVKKWDIKQDSKLIKSKKTRKSK